MAHLESQIADCGAVRHQQKSAMVAIGIHDCPYRIKSWVYNDQLTGTIPVSIGHLKHLFSISLNGTNFRGTLPMEIAD